MNLLDRELEDQRLKRLIKEVLEENTPTHKEIIKEAYTEWLNDKWADFGKWSFGGLMAATFAVILFLWAKSKGLM